MPDIETLQAIGAFLNIAGLAGLAIYLVVYRDPLQRKEDEEKFEKARSEYIAQIKGINTQNNEQLEKMATLYREQLNKQTETCMAELAAFRAQAEETRRMYHEHTLGFTKVLTEIQVLMRGR